MKPKTSTIVRVTLLAVALANMALATLNIVPEEIVGNTQAYQIGSYIVTAVIAVINMWKNNSFSPEAIIADEYLKALREDGKAADDKAEDVATTLEE